jgi:chitinase
MNKNTLQHNAANVRHALMSVVSRLTVYTASAHHPMARVLTRGVMALTLLMTAQLAIATPVNTTAANFINAGAATTNNRTVTLAISATDTVGVVAYRPSESSTNPTAATTGWITVTSTTAYSANVSFTLTSSNGTKTVYVWFKDAAGNVSARVSDTITLDTTAPTNTTAANFINAGAAATNSITVTLAISATDAMGVTAYRPSTSSTTPTAATSGWITVTSTTSYSANVSFTLTSSNGTKTVYVWFKDAAGNVSTGTSDTITLDTVAPTLSTGPTSSVITASGATIAWTTNEASNTQVDYGLTTSYGSSATTATLTTSHSQALTGLTAATTYHYRVKSTDAAGNLFTGTDNTFITLASSNNPPSVSLTAPANNATYTAPATITLSATASDSDGTVSKVEFFQGTTLITTVTTSPYTATWSNVATGVYSLTAKATDNLNATTTSTPISITVNPPIQAYYIHTDHLNTPRVISDQTQKTVWRWQNTEGFGNSLAEEDPDNDGILFTCNLRYPGQYFDKETGLHYNYYRDYDPSTGRYVESDPIGLKGGINTYAYAGFRPLTVTDPKGLMCTSSNGMTTCSYPGGPTFSVPTPPDFPTNLSNYTSVLYHLYKLQSSIGCADPSAVMQAIINSPTPGDPVPATQNGTKNNAQVLGGLINNAVISYLTSDLKTGAPVVVNITAGSGSNFAPGYVARTVSNGTINTYGEGQGILQSTTIWGNSTQNFFNNLVWGPEMKSAVSKCGCTH